MNALFLLLWSQATLLAVDPVSDSVCPSPRQVSDSIVLRMPGVLVDPRRARSLGALQLRLQMTVEGAPGFVLVDAKDRIRLSRPLEPGPDAFPGQCAALAETVALIVDRFLQQMNARGSGVDGTLKERAGSLPADPGRASDGAPQLAIGRPWRLSMAGALRVNDRLSPAGGATLRGGRGFGGGLALLLSGSVGLFMREAHSLSSLPKATAVLHRVPFDLGVQLRLPLGGGEGDFGLAVGLDLLLASGQVVRAERTIVSPWVGPVVGFTLPLGRWAFLRSSAGVGLHLTRVQILERQGDVSPLFDTGRYHLKAEIEGGTTF